jgi:hypothetical protein
VFRQDSHKRSRVPESATASGIKSHRENHCNLISGRAEVPLIGLVY